MIKRVILTLALSVGTLFAQGNATDLVGLLTQELGVTKQQAEGGTGSLLTFAKSALSGEEFSQVSGALEGIGTLMGSTPKKGDNSAMGALGGIAAAALGGGEKKNGAMGSVASDFTILGMDVGMIAKFVPLILQYFQDSDEGDAASLLYGVLSPK